MQILLGASSLDNSLLLFRVFLLSWHREKVTLTKYIKYISLYKRAVYSVQGASPVSAVSQNSQLKIILTPKGHILGFRGGIFFWSHRMNDSDFCSLGREWSRGEHVTQFC